MASLLHSVRRTSKSLVRAVFIRRDSSFHLLGQRDVTPAICYDDCDGAYKIAQSYGKSPELCEANSTFQDAYDICKSCIDDNSSDGNKTVGDYMSPQVEKFIEFCSEQNATATSTRSGTATKTNLNTAEVETAAATAGCESCKVITVTDYKSRVIAYTLGSEAVTGSLSNYNPAVATPTSLIPDADETSPGPNIATIVGPVVPSFVLLLLLGFLGFRWFRPRRAAKAQRGHLEDEEKPKEDKPQLHSECISRPTFELEGSVPVVTYGDGAKAKGKSEMAANEPAAHEMSTEKRISRKPVGG